MKLWSQEKIDFGTQSKKPKCPECKRKVAELVNGKGVCWKCHIGSVQKGKLR